VQTRAAQVSLHLNEPWVNDSAGATVPLNLRAMAGASRDHVGARYNAGFIVLSYFVSVVGCVTTLELIHRQTSRHGAYNW
jgi:hypothetical protein